MRDLFRVAHVRLACSQQGLYLESKCQLTPVSRKVSSSAATAAFSAGDYLNTTLRARLCENAVFTVERANIIG